MAQTPEEIQAIAAAQAELNKAIAEYNRLSGLSIKNPINPDNFKDATTAQRALNDEIHKYTELNSKASKEASKASKEAAKEKREEQREAHSLNKTLREYEKLTGSKIKNKVLRENYKDAAEYAEALAEEQSRINELILNASSGLEGISSRFQEIGKEIKAGFGNSTSKAVKSVTKIHSLTEQLFDAQQDLTQVSVKDIKIQKEKANAEFARLDRQLKGLDQAEKDNDLQRDTVNQQIKSGEITQKQGIAQLAKLTEEGNKLSELKNIAEERSAEEKYKSGILKDINVAYDETIKRVDNINSATGLTGKILEGVGGTLEKLGFKGMGEKVSAINQTLKETAVELTDNGKNTLSLNQKFGLLKQGVQGVGAELITSLKDPLVIAGLLLSAFKKIGEVLISISQEITDLGRSMGLTRDAADTMYTSIKNSALSSGSLLGNTEDMLDAQMSIAKVMGTTAKLTGKELEAQVALTKLAGLSNEQAAKLYKYSLLTGKSSEELYDSVAAQGDGLLDNNQILKEALEIEGQLAAQYRNDPKLIAAAVRQVKLLGISLQDAAGMGKSMLDFESSIEAELEAQLLTGRSLNLSKARGLFLQGKVAEGGAEALKQAGSLAEFQKSGPIAQEAMAKAMGTSTDQLAESLALAETLNEVRRQNPGLTNEQANLEAQRRNMSFSEKIAFSVNKIKDDFAAVFKFMTPVLDGVASLIGSITSLPSFVKIGAAMGVVAGGIALFTRGIPAIFTYFKNQLTKPDGSITRKINTKIDPAQVQQIVNSVGGGSGGSGGTGGTGGSGGTNSGGSKGKGRASKTGMTKSGKPDMRTKAGRQMKAPKMRGGGMLSKLGGAGGAVMSGLSMAATAAPLAMSMGGRSIEEAGAESGNRTKETIGSSMGQTGDVGLAKQATSFLGGITGKAGALLSKMSPGNAVKKLISSFGPKITSALPKMAKGIPFLGSAIETIFAGKDIAAMMASGMPEEDVHQNIGRRAFQAIGGLLGGGGASLAIQAANIVPGLGVVLTPLAGLAGDFIGRSLGGLLADASPSMAGAAGKGLSNLFGQSDKIKKGDKIQNAAGKISNPDKQTIKANDFTIQTNPADTLVMAGGTQFGKETNDILSKILNAVQSGGDVYIDGNKAGEALVMGTYKAS
jgi:hypothetical protein